MRLRWLRRRTSLTGCLRGSCTQPDTNTWRKSKCVRYFAQKSALTRRKLYFYAENSAGISAALRSKESQYSILICTFFFSRKSLGVCFCLSLKKIWPPSFKKPKKNVVILCLWCSIDKDICGLCKAKKFVVQNQIFVFLLNLFLPSVTRHKNYPNLVINFVLQCPWSAACNKIGWQIVNSLPLCPPPPPQQKNVFVIFMFILSSFILFEMTIMF